MMSKKWTEELDEKLVYDYEHLIMPYLASRLSVIAKKYGVAANYEEFQEDNERMLELMRQGISLINNASGIRRIMRRLDDGTIVRGFSDPEGWAIGYVPHWSTCPAASEFKRKK